ncbi:MAG: TldD/PmbA family protein [Lentisphaerae bacterium]|nr:TldD/PmbA family protein [Lentisphaerota bacterium]MBT4819133.1 TldD/PmbA family protein [Lentisphaerota bacterium]MBT5607974.1 TldD/PmbA family protein [Lentisphaerota bacterium]MBT7057501.1 TldD/PmbA family protein [Lentisphaerota bacterium]MBT7845647.1 TldD/PmbA family protein [Lentisphaerota bacterium]
MKDRLHDALRHSTADYAEIRFELEENTSLAYRGREIENASRSTFMGGIVRACTKGGWGVVTFDSPEGLADHVREACACAALVGREVTELAEVPPVEQEQPAQMQRDFRGVSLDEKLKLIDGYNTILLTSTPAIETSTASYSDAFRTVHFASTRGAYYMEERPRMVCRLRATARDGSLVQNAHKSVSSTTTYDAALGLEQTAEEVSARAAALLKAPKCDGGPKTVILDPEMAGVFIHEAFGHLSEADFLYENAKMRDLMHLGREIGVPELSVIDDGGYPDLIGTQAYDDEGTPTGETHLITDGVLSAHLHSRETAAKMGEKPTGNARAIGRGVPPIVRMTNTYIANGDTPVEDLFAGVNNGIYACGMFGGQTALEMFTFSAAYAYRIENGRKGELLRDVTLTGNVFETLKAIDGIADDLVLCRIGGGCGKGGQAPLPVSFGSPHVRIQDVVVGGN